MVCTREVEIISPLTRMCCKSQPTDFQHSWKKPECFEPHCVSAECTFVAGMNRNEKCALYCIVRAASVVNSGPQDNVNTDSKHKQNFSHTHTHHIYVHKYKYVQVKYIHRNNIKRANIRHCMIVIIERFLGHPFCFFIYNIWLRQIIIRRFKK